MAVEKKTEKRAPSFLRQGGRKKADLVFCLAMPQGRRESGSPRAQHRGKGICTSKRERKEHSRIELTEDAPEHNQLVS